MNDLLNKYQISASRYTRGEGGKGTSDSGDCGGSRREEVTKKTGFEAQMALWGPEVVDDNTRQILRADRRDRQAWGGGQS